MNRQKLIWRTAKVSVLFEIYSPCSHPKFPNQWRSETCAVLYFELLLYNKKLASFVIDLLFHACKNQLHKDRKWATLSYCLTSQYALKRVDLETGTIKYLWPDIFENFPEFLSCAINITHVEGLTPWKKIKINYLCLKTQDDLYTASFQTIYAGTVKVIQDEAYTVWFDVVKGEGLFEAYAIQENSQLSLFLRHTYVYLSKTLIIYNNDRDTKGSGD